MKAITPIQTDWVRAIKVTMPHPKKWPMSGINAATKTIIPIATGEGMPRTKAKITTKTAAIAAIKI